MTQMGTAFDSTMMSGQIGILLGMHNAGDSPSVVFDNFDLYTNR